MDQLLQERLQILKEAGMMDEIGERAAEFMLSRLEADGVKTTDENIGMFLTHLIAAINRMKTEEAIEEVNPDLKSELLKNPFYPKTQWYFSEMEKQLGIRMEEAEEIYVGGYLCILFSQGKEERK